MPDPYASIPEEKLLHAATRQPALTALAAVVALLGLPMLLSVPVLWHDVQDQMSYLLASVGSFLTGMGLLVLVISLRRGHERSCVPIALYFVFEAADPALLLAGMRDARSNAESTGMAAVGIAFMLTLAIIAHGGGKVLREVRRRGLWEGVFPKPPGQTLFLLGTILLAIGATLCATKRDIEFSSIVQQATTERQEPAPAAADGKQTSEGLLE